jgi:signal transduction histidine kinase
VFTPVLTDLGPVAALREAVRNTPVRTSIVAGRLGRYSPEVERAMYFCCLEALQNAYKHARDAGAVRVTISQRRHTLASTCSTKVAASKSISSATARGCATCAIVSKG